MQAKVTARTPRSVSGRWVLALLVAVVGDVGQGDVARASSESPAEVSRTAPYDEDRVFTASNSSCQTDCSMSATADKTVGDLGASIEIEPPVHDQLTPGLRKYWYGQSNAALRVRTIPAGPGTTRWTARVHISSALAKASASSGSAHSELVVGFGLTDANQASEPFVQGTIKYMSSTGLGDSISAGELVLQFELSLASAGVYNAYVAVYTAGRVANSPIARTDPVPLPCLIGVPFGRGLTICVPPDVPSQAAYGTADGHARSSIAARVNSVSVTTS
jgi:hypothetical protein